MGNMHTPEMWCALTGIRILDPDGWDRTDFARDWAIPLTWQEFREKAGQSTASGPAGWWEWTP